MLTEHNDEANDPGLFVLDVWLRLLDVPPESNKIIERAGAGPIDIAGMLRYGRSFGLQTRLIETTWDEFSCDLLPGIAVLKNGSFLVLANVNEDKAVVLRPGATRPILLTRSEFESQWDGRLIVAPRESKVSSRQRRYMTAMLDRMNIIPASIGVSLRNVFRKKEEKDASPSSSRRGVVVRLADRSRQIPRNLLRRKGQAFGMDELAFLPAALEIVETPPSPIGRTIAFSIMVLFAAALAWASIGTVDIVAVAPGKFIPSGRTKTIQPFETGVVRAIHVRDGQRVKAGDVLIDLDSTINAAELGRMRSDLMAARFDVARLRTAIARAKDPNAAFIPPDNATPELVQTHTRFLESQIVEQKAKISVVDGQVALKEAERATIRTSIDKLTATISPLQQRVQIREQLFNKELGSKLTYLTELQDLVGQQQEIRIQQSRYNEIDAAVASLIDTRQKTIAEYERVLFDELTKVEQKAAGLAQDVIKAEQRTSLQRLVAPVDGVVQQLAVHTIGGVVTPAQGLVIIVPANERLEIEAMVSNKDVGFVEVGQEAAVKVDTFLFTRYGLLRGEVLNVSQDAIARDNSLANGRDPEKSGKGEGETKGQELSYIARISVDRTYMDIENKHVNLTPGMAVTAEIKTGTRSILSYLLSPLARYKHDSLRER